MKKRMISILALACMVCLLLAGCQSSKSGSSVASEARNGTVRVMEWYNSFEIRFVDQHGDIREDFGGYTSKAFWLYGSGTGFGVGTVGQETNTFVTNRHVVDGGYEIREISSDINAAWNFVLEETLTLDPDLYQRLYDLVRQNPTVRPVAMGEPTGIFILLDDYAFREGTLDLNHAVECKILYRGNEYEPDLAVIQTMDGQPVSGRVALPLLDVNETVESGDTVFSLGFPGTTDDNNPTLAASVDRVTVTNGIISLHSQLVDDNGTLTDILQHTAQINHGNSGGPLIDDRGAVVGVNTWGWGQNDNTGDSGVNASIEIKYVRDRLDDLRINWQPYKAGISISPVVVIAIAAAAVIVIVVVVVAVTRKPGPGAVTPPPVSVRPPEPPRAAEPPVSSPGPAQPPARPVIAGDTGLRVQGITGHFAGRRFAITGQLRIGRDPARNDLVYPADSQGVSGVHCVLIVEGGRLLLKDLGSTYGTFVGGNRLAANAPTEVQVGDRFCLGSERETFVVARKGEA